MPFYARKSTRIPGYDYTAANYYFITICTHEKTCIFGEAGALNSFGALALKGLSNIEKRFPHISIDNCIVMPNHVHAIIRMGEGEKGISLDQVVGLYKSGVSRQIHQIDPTIKVWQRSFHDHVIRNQKEYENIWSYVEYNDQKWNEDCYYLEES